MHGLILKTSADDSDIANIAVIEGQLFEDAWGFDSVKALLSQSINNVILLKNAETIVAYCLYQQLFETAEILRIATHPDYQRKGFANQLLRAWIALMKSEQATNLLLEVRADNVAAIKLYQKLGFNQIDTRKGYYQSKFKPDSAVDAWIMQLEA